MKCFYHLLFILPIVSFGQSTDYKYDANWVIGYIYNDLKDSIKDGMLLHFSNGQMREDSFLISEGVDDNAASISDKNGNLQFYSNGCVILNKKFVMMENGDSMNLPSYATSERCFDHMGNGGYRTTFIIPNPDSANIYNIIHFKAILGELNYFSPEILLTKVDMSYNNGLGKVIFKNKLLYEDYSEAQPIESSYSTVLTKHGNGRDWWLIVSKANTNKVIALRFDHYGFKDTVISELPEKYIISHTASSSISPDGKYYMRAGVIGSVEIIGFDRCYGTMTSYQKLAMPTNPKGNSIGTCVSPNSRFLYYTNRSKIFQYDLHEPDIISSEYFLGEVDTVNYDFLPEYFFLMQVAADGKLYICSTNGVKRLHVINNPDEPGAACNFVRRGVILHSWIFLSLPYFPNYNLDPVPGACSIGTNNPGVLKIEIYPNPASDYITLGKLAGQKIKYEIRNINGSLCLSGIYTGSSIFVGDLPAGIYTVMALSDGKQFLGKLAKID